MRKFSKTIAAIVMMLALSLAAPMLPAHAAINNFDLATAKETYTAIPGTLIYTDGLTSEEVQTEVISAYLQLPESVRETLVRYDICVYLSQMANHDDAESIAAYLDGTPGSTIAAAVTSMGTVWHQGETITRVDNMPYIVYFSSLAYDGDTLIHEVGHALDYLAMVNSGKFTGSFYGISDSDEWQAIYAADGAAIAAIDRLTAINASKNSCECFAEAFRLVYTDPEALESVSPAAYQFVLEAVANITGTGN